MTEEKNNVLTSAPLYSGFPSIYLIFWIRVLAMSTGIDAAVVTRPDNILATKCTNIPSDRYPGNDQ